MTFGTMDKEIIDSHWDKGSESDEHNADELKMKLSKICDS